jgi:putative membrane protein
MKEAQKPASIAKADIRHYMAVDRTIMANERTLLAYSRMGLTLVVSGLGFIHFTDSYYLQMISITFIPIGLGTFTYGVIRFLKKRKSIHEQRNKLDQLT